MTTRERILTLQENRIEEHVIAAILGISEEAVSKTLSTPGYTPPDPEGGFSEAHVFNDTDQNVVIGTSLPHAVAHEVTQTTIFGFDAGTNLEEANGTTLFGAYAGQSLKGGNNNTLIGREAGRSLTLQGGNTFIGAEAGELNTEVQSVAVGWRAMHEAPGEFAVAIGVEAARKTAGLGVVAVGWNAAHELVTGPGVFVGYKAGAAIVNTAEGVTVVGHEACAEATGPYGTFIGLQAGKVNEGKNNTFVGTLAGTANTTGEENTFIGDETGFSNTTGKENCFVGGVAGAWMTAGSENTFVGVGAGKGAGGETLKDQNIVVGHEAASLIKGGSGNVIIGTKGPPEAVSNRLILGNTPGFVLISGNFSGEPAEHKLRFYDEEPGVARQKVKGATVTAKELAEKLGALGLLTVE